MDAIINNVLIGLVIILVVMVIYLDRKGKFTQKIIDSYARIMKSDSTKRRLAAEQRVYDNSFKLYMVVFIKEFMDSETDTPTFIAGSLKDVIDSYVFMVTRTLTTNNYHSIRHITASVKKDLIKVLKGETDIRDVEREVFIVEKENEEGTLEHVEISNVEILKTFKEHYKSFNSGHKIFFK